MYDKLRTGITDAMRVCLRDEISRKVTASKATRQSCANGQRSDRGQLPAVLISGETRRTFRNPRTNLSDQFTRVRAFTMVSSYLEGNLSGVKAPLLLETGKEASSRTVERDARRDVSSRGRRRSPVSRRLSSQNVPRTFACAAARAGYVYITICLYARIGNLS